MAIDRAHAKHRASVGDDGSFLRGKKLVEVTFEADRTRLRFEGGAVLDIAGDVEHRVGTDILGRAVPDKRVLPSLMHLVGMTVRQVGAEAEGVLLRFEDGHEVRVFSNAAVSRS